MELIVTTALLLLFTANANCNWMWWKYAKHFNWFTLKKP